MSAGLFGLLDDVAAIAKLAATSLDDVSGAAAKATTKAVGVVVDDTAVTPQYVQGIAAEREIPIVAKIAKGSIRNKLVFILPVALILSQWAHWALAWILIVGGAYLVYEGAEKVLEWFEHEHHDETAASDMTSGEQEKSLVAGAVRTDLVLSAEIMLIALNEVADESFWSRLVILVIVAIAMTIGVYGVVAVIVKMDDAGLSLSQRGSRLVRLVGRGLVEGMPPLLSTLSVVGTVAMLWVGGHILLSKSSEVGWKAPYRVVLDWEHHAHHATGAIGPAVGWLVNTGCSAIVGVAVGLLLLGALALARQVRHRAH